MTTENNDDFLNERFGVKPLEQKHVATFGITCLVDEHFEPITHHSQPIIDLIQQYCRRYFRHLIPRKRELTIKIEFSEVIRKGDII